MEVKLEFISMEVFKSMSLEEKISYILEHVKQDKILVLDGAMTPQEESKLIEATMEKVSDDFPGIEVSTLQDRSLESWRESLIRMLGGSPRGLSVIGPSRLVSKVKKDPRRITIFAGAEQKNASKKKK
ncbi:MAG TPA: DUF2073 domain-containing protein [Candidatus Altiarchaeales archaeon]|nr:DUF2073 domain-containing protein [Candidatus Altiarchaeales archaeon]